MVYGQVLFLIPMNGFFKLSPDLAWKCRVLLYAKTYLFWVFIVICNLIKWF